MLRYNSIILLCFIYITLIIAKLHNERLIKSDLVIKKDKTQADYIHDVVFCVKQDIDILDSMLLDRSTPGSSNYQKWLTGNDIADILKIKESYDNIIEYLNQYQDIEIKNVTIHHEYIIASAPISIWENIFNTNFYDWHDMRMDTKKVHVLAEEYAIPIEIEDYVDFILNTVQLPPVINYNKPSKIPLEAMNEYNKAANITKKSDHILATPPPPPPSYTTLKFLNELYGITSNVGSSSLSQAVFQTNDEQWSPADLTKFQNFMNVPLQSAIDISNTATSNCRASDNQNGVPCEEANLDIQYIMGIAQKTKSYVWWVDNTALYGNTFLQFLFETSSIATPPSVLSVSWGSNEGAYPLAYIEAFNTKAAFMGLQGVSILVASGDDGAYGTSSSGCVCSKYDPSFPATSPYVTAVGATMGPNDWKTEVACQADTNGAIVKNSGGVITTGGGFSAKQSTPSWQTNSKTAYLNSADGQSTVAGYGSGRGIPDVAFIGTQYIVAINQKYYLMYGTSASAPLFAGMISLINKNRLASGLGTAGFLNPTLYANSNKFNDIVSGNNKCCSSKCCSSNLGFKATSGWDPVTGLGSIDFDVLNSLYTLTSAPTVAPTYRPTLVSRAPTLSPTLRPTNSKNSPTIEPTFGTDIIFDTTFTIVSAVDISALLSPSNSNYEVYCISIKQAISENMKVNYDDISLNSITAGRRLNLILTSINSVSINFRVTTSSYTSNIYAQAVALFQQNYNSGAFAQSLNTNAYYNGATGLVFALVTSLTIGKNMLSPTLSPTPGPTDFYQNYYFIIAVSAAGAALIIFFASMAYYYRSRKLLICVGLPQDFNVEDLRLVLPGIKSVRKMRTKVLITFTTNTSATFNYRNCKNGAVYYFDHRIKLQWASLLCLEKCLGSSYILSRQEAYMTQPRVAPPPMPQSVAPYRTEILVPNETPHRVIHDLPVAVAQIAAPGGRYFSYNAQSEHSNNETVINIGSLQANKINNSSGSSNNANRNSSVESLSSINRNSPAALNTANRNTANASLNNTDRNNSIESFVELYTEPSAPTQDN